MFKKTRKSEIRQRYNDFARFSASRRVQNARKIQLGARLERDPIRGGSCKKVFKDFGRFWGPSWEPESEKNNRKNKGTITFSYHDTDQLNKIIDIIKSNY